MNDYDAINDEIKNFLTLTDKQSKENVVPIKDLKTGKEDISSLITLLTNLQNVYSEINTNLAAGDNEGLKNTLLNSEVKMSLVCESLMRVLKDVCQEKNDLVQNEEKYKDRVKKLEEEKEGLEIKVSRMESDLDFTNRGNQELSRIIKDQKNKIQGFKEKADLEKRYCDSFRSINEELEVLRKKALEKCDVYDKEIGVLKEYLKEKGEDIRRVKEGSRQTEAEKEALSKRMIGLEKSNEMLRKKLEMKENALGLCNSELSRLISKEKRMESELEGLKEKSSYYERLYKATNNQNEYLNSQLARMISMGNGDKIEIPEYNPDMQQDTVAEEDKADTKTSNKSYLRKLKRYKRKSLEQREANEGQKTEIQNLTLLVERLKDENARLREEKTKAISGNTKITDDLMSKVERLLEKNREYQTAIYELKGKQGAGIGKDLKENVAKAKPDFDESFKTVNDGEEELHPSGNEYSIFRNPEKDRAWRSKGGLRPFALENDYEKEPNREGPRSTSYDLGGKRFMNFDINNIHSKLNSFREDKLENVDKPGISSTKLNIPDRFYKSLASPKKMEREPRPHMEKDSDGNLSFKASKKGEIDSNLIISERNSYPVDPFNSVPNDGFDRKLDGRPELVSGSDTTSPRTVRTTSTLHEMLKRTDALQEKFDKLEDQLNLIKNSDKAEADKVQDQIKAYKNYYYSDYLDMSNESDFI